MNVYKDQTSKSIAMRITDFFQLMFTSGNDITRDVRKVYDRIGPLKQQMVGNSFKKIKYVHVHEQ